MNAPDPLARAHDAYERAVFAGDLTDLEAAEHDLAALAAEVTLSRGRLLPRVS